MRYWLIFTVLVALMPLGHAADSEFVAPSVALEKRDAQSTTLAQADSPQTRTITGSPLTIRVGSDYAFQILNSSVPGVGQIYPSGSAGTANMGWFVQVGSASYSPNFRGYGAWTPGSTSAVSGAGTSADPFRITVTNGLPAQSLNSTQVVTYVNGENFFRKKFTLSNSGTVAISAKVFLGADIYLAGNDSGVPQLLNGAPGGKNCPGTTGNYNIMLIPQGSITPSAYSARSYGTVWNEIRAGALSNVVDTVCEDNGAALQWNISVPAGGTTTVEAATSFGDIPAIITCGTANGQTLTETPTSGLCGTGSTASSVTPNTNAYNWSCTGGGVVAQCLAARNYIVTATTGTNGSITPSTQKVAYNATPSFTVTANSGYKIQSVTGCSGTLVGNTYTTGPIAAACSVSASFVPEAPVAGCGASNNQTLTSAPSSNLCTTGSASTVTSGNTSYTWSCTGSNTSSCSATRNYIVTPSAGANGSISPNTAQNVAYNATPSFTVTPNSGYKIQSVTGCSGSLSGNTYTTGPIIASCNVLASFLANVAPVATSLSLSGTAQIGQVLTGSYAYSDADADAENTAGSGSAYRFVRSTDNSMATTGDNVSLASGSTGGSNKTYTVQAADLGKVLFYCVTPKANTGVAVGTEVCSGGTAAVISAPIAGECGSAISRTLSSPPLGANDSTALCKIGTATRTGAQTWSCSSANGSTSTSCSSSVPLDGGLVGYWSFEGNANLASGVAADAQVLGGVSFDTVKSGSVLDGQVSGGVSFDTGKIGKAAVFGGVDNPGQIKIANASTLQFTTGATFSVWVRFDGMKGMDDSGKTVLGTGFSEAMLAKNAIFKIGTNTTNSGVFSNGPYDMCFSLNGSPICSPAPGAALWQPMLEIGEWVHVAYVLSATDGVRQYVNGKLYSASPSPFSFSTMNAEDLYLGNSKDARFPLLGALDELQIYNRALGEAEIGLLTNLDVVEFYHSSLDHYFITADANEAKAVDSGVAGAEWKRTGTQFKSVGSAAVCRFYGSMSPGPNSHFYTADANECAGLKQLHDNTPPSEKRWNYESIAFAATLPTAGGVCPTGMTPIYRAYNNGSARGVDSNHRITSNLADIQQVVARGWKEEGVVMCASQ